MNDCHQTREAIEAALHGALDVDGAARMHAHLETCDACRAYRAEAEGIERVLTSCAQRVEESVDWRRLDRKLARMRHRRYAVVVLRAAWLLTVVTAAILVHPLVLVVLLGAVSSLREALTEVRQERNAQELLSGTSDWLQHYREDVRRRAFSAVVDHGLLAWVQALFFGFLALVGKYTVPVGLVALAWFLYGVISFFRAYALRREYASSAPEGEMQVAGA